LTGNRGVLKICFLGLELRSHVAKKMAVTLPNGHASIDRRVHQCFCKSVFHLKPAKRNTISPRLSKLFLISLAFDLTAGIFMA
jgi:hypothetical protein